MKLKLSATFFFFFISASTPILQVSNNGVGGFKLEENESHVKISDFPSGFLFGAATSAYQVYIPNFLSFFQRKSYEYIT